MNQTWRLPFPWVSDPDGTRMAKPLQAWNDKDRGGLFHPIVVLVGPDGRRPVEHRSRDFADRADDDDVLSALRELALPPRPTPAPWQPDLAPKPSGNAFRVDAFGPYFRGIRSNTKALAGRMRDEQDAAEIRQSEHMAASFLDAWTQRRES